MTEPKEKAGKQEGEEGGERGVPAVLGKVTFQPLPQNSPRFVYGKALS